MMIPHCVKCGKPADTSDPVWRDKRFYPPSCEKHSNETHNEAMKEYSMWPHEYVGGWIWDDTRWEHVKYYATPQSGV